MKRAGPGDLAAPIAVGFFETLAAARIRCVRRVISAAARRVKVSSKIRSGMVPVRIRWATR
jgi:hypothetical protein